MAEKQIGITENIHLPSEALAEYCRRRHIQKLAFFGSVLDERFTPDSDVDVLVEFEPGHVPGLSFFDMQDELSALLGRQVELHTPSFLSRHFRDQVLSDAHVEYVQR